MPRQPLILALAAGLLILLSTINVFHRIHPDLLLFPWQPRNHESSFRVGVGSELPEVMDITSDDGLYLLGVGKGDITGPIVEINFMGYADPQQVGSGLRQRLYSRAFIIGDLDSPDDRIVYLVLDTQSGDTAIRHGILEALKGMGDEYAIYGQQNVAVTGTHSHSGPGAWLNYLLPQITSYGFYKPSYQAIVDGAVHSIVQAHQSLAPGRLSIGTIDIGDANVNRSPYAYLANPAHERDRYQHDVDKAMTVLRFSHNVDDRDQDIGILTWFAVHGTSMLGNNTLVSGDNKGVAAWMFEKSMGNKKFVAGFSQANVGDTSPNVLGAYCESGENAGERCDFKTSLCGNRTQPCHGRGPYFGLNDGGAASSYEIGIRQFAAARELFEDVTAFSPIHGKTVRSVHHFQDLSNYHFGLPNGTSVHTCPAALGYSFAAGTTDGPGAFDFKQAQPGDPHANPLWHLIGDRIHKPNETQIACHAEKVILLDVGESADPYPWSPNIVDIQLFRIGQLFIIVAPGEASTMAGRRWRNALHDEVLTLAVFNDFTPESQQPTVVLGGPANTYSHYITTREEYAVQRYEGASTLYGPHTLDAFINLTCTYLVRLAAETVHLPSFDQGPSPPILINDSLSFIRPVVVDNAPLFKSFGDVKDDVKAIYFPGDTIEATFVGANPRNEYRLGRTFAAVEQFDYELKSWKRIRDDSDWSLIFEWKRTNELLGTSEVKISWETKWETGVWREDGIGKNDLHGDLFTRGISLQGLYRLVYYGDAKHLDGKIEAFKGLSGEFKIV